MPVFHSATPPAVKTAAAPTAIHGHFRRARVSGNRETGTVAGSGICSSGSASSPSSGQSSGSSSRACASRSSRSENQRVSFSVVGSSVAGVIGSGGFSSLGVFSLRSAASDGTEETDGSSGFSVRFSSGGFGFEGTASRSRRTRRPFRLPVGFRQPFGGWRGPRRGGGNGRLFHRPGRRQRRTMTRAGRAGSSALPVRRNPSFPGIVGGIQRFRRPCGSGR